MDPTGCNYPASNCLRRAAHTDDAAIADDAAAADDIRSRGFFGAVKIYFRECFRNPYYRWVFAMLALAGLAAVPVNFFSVFYMKSLHMDGDTYGKIKALNHTCGILVAFPIGMMLARR